MLVKFITIDICFAYEIEQPITAISRHLINLTTSIHAESLVAVKAIKAFRRINETIENCDLRNDRLELCK